MNELELKEKVANEEQEQVKTDVAKLIEDLRKQGLEDEQILEALNKMLEEGKITEEDLAKAQELLKGEDKQKAEELFDMKLI